MLSKTIVQSVNSTNGSKAVIVISTSRHGRRDVGYIVLTEPGLSVEDVFAHYVEVERTNKKIPSLFQRIMTRLGGTEHPDARDYT